MNEDQAAAQVIRMVTEGRVRSLQGIDVNIKADTICIHGDGEHALTFANKIHQSLKESNVLIRSPQRD